MKKTEITDMLGTLIMGGVHILGYNVTGHKILYKLLHDDFMCKVQ